MCKDDHDLAMDFLKHAIDRLESRISMVDNKAAILIAVSTGLTAVLTFVAEKVLWGRSINAYVSAASYPAFAIMLLWLLVVVFLLLQTIRPTNWLLGCGAGLSKYRPGLFSLLWPPKGFMLKRKDRPADRQDYEAALKVLPKAARADYEQTHFALCQLVRRKYRHYSRAVWLLKSWVLVIFILVGVATWVALGEYKSWWPTTLPASG